MTIAGEHLITTINETEPSPNKLAFWWLGQMGWIIKVKATVLYFDPYLANSSSRLVPPLVQADQVTNASMVLGSHNHGDHIDPQSIPAIAAASPQATFLWSRVANHSERVKAFQLPAERVVEMDEGVVYDREGLRVNAVAVPHEFFDHDPLLGYPYLAFIVETGGFTILHMGDALVYEGLLAKLSSWKFDIVFLPINGRDAARYQRQCWGNMTFQEAVDLIGTLRPRLAVPGHYDMFAGNMENPQNFADYLRCKFPDQSFQVCDYGVTYTLDKD